MRVLTRHHERCTGTSTRSARRATRSTATAGRVLSLAIASILVAAIALPASAVRIQDITHLKGRRENRLLGYGLVVGLSGTGDGSKFETTIITLQSLLSKYGMPVPASMLKDAKNVAVVLVTATLPDNGVREGDPVDVEVSSIGVAKSLAGGRLIMTPLQGPGREAIYAWASGSVRLTDVKLKTSGVIRRGAVMEADVIHSYIAEDYTINLVLEDDFASWPWAAAIAERINEDASEIGQVREFARALGPKNVVVTIPAVNRENPAAFIANIEQIELLLPPSEAKVVINRRTETIVISGDVEIGPAVIAHNGMSIMITQPVPKPTAESPLVREDHVVGIESPKSRRGGTRLQMLVSSLNELHVPAKDIIEIIENLARTGKLTGKLEFVE